MIAIIAILASMLLPALSKARAKARTTSCLSQMKQFGLGSLMYSDENDNYSPPGCAAGNLEHFTNAIAPYVGVSYYRVNIWGHVGNSFCKTPNNSDNSAVSTKLFVCPAARRERMAGNFYHLYGKDGSTYAITQPMGCGKWWGNASPGSIQTGQSLSKVNRPSRKIHYFDEKPASIPYAVPRTSFMEYAEFRHDNHINLTFVDGHASSNNKIMDQVEYWELDK